MTPWRVLAQPQDQPLTIPEDAALGAGVVAVPVETPAQKADAADRARQENDQTTWRAARVQMGGADQSNEKQKPAETLAAYQAWLAAHPDLHPSVIAESGVAIARLQLSSGDKDGANTTLQGLWDKLSANDGGLLVRATQAGFLLEGAAKEDKAKAAVDVQTMLEPLIGRAMEASHKTGTRFVPGRALLQQYAEALRAQNKGLEVAAFAQKVMLDAPEFLAGTLQNENGWLYDATIKTLVADARPEAAPLTLQWAKLNWIERDFSVRGVQDSARLVAQALLAQPNGSELLSQWAKAQKDSAVPNPLKSVVLPPAEPKAMEELLQTMGTDRKWQQARVSVLLWQERDHEAMEAAVQGADKIPETAKAERLGVMHEVARVFKASDLNLKRANGYLGWFANPVGNNPLDTFLAEVPAKEGAKTTEAGAKDLGGKAIATAVAGGGP